MAAKRLVSVSLADIVERALSACGEGKYVLGKGGRNPQADSPLQDGACDCSGFVAWCIGLDRYQPGKVAGGDWIETSAMVRDANYDRNLFVPMNERRPGYILVWGDKNGRQGHTGIISAVDAHGKVTRVIHCSSGNYRTKGVAIAETDPGVFLTNGAMVVRFKGTVEATDPECVGVR